MTDPEHCPGRRHGGNILASIRDWYAESWGWSPFDWMGAILGVALCTLWHMAMPPGPSSCRPTFEPAPTAVAATRADSVVAGSRPGRVCPDLRHRFALR